MSFKTYYPGGKSKALTLSYDDGQIFDRRLVEIFNKYNMKGTFHLNSGTLGKDGYVTQEEVKELYAGHEVSCHSVTHPYFTQISQGQLTQEIWEDRRNLERLTGYTMRGMSYPFGVYDDRTLKTLELTGIEYSRTVNATNGFNVPADFLQWHPTCHHSDNLPEKLEKFKNQPAWLSMPLFYIWGHSYEFDRQNNWDMIENFCSEASGDDNVWYASNIEIKDYITALRSLVVNVDETLVYNPTAITVWLGRNNKISELKPGQTLEL
jgi:peptidoglycan/xylan/chitin deacetylase (PgdA/CDA1 family)